MSRATVVAWRGSWGPLCSNRCCCGLSRYYRRADAAVGGKMAQVEVAGFRWDTGPSVITMRHVLEDVFTAAGRKLEDYLTLLPVNPLTRYFWPDGSQLDASADLTEMTERIAAISPEDVDGYRRYLEYASEIHRVTGPVFIYDKPPRPSSFLRVPWLIAQADPFAR